MSSRRDYTILDTSVIIDGRIADVAQTGFLCGTFVIPQFGLREFFFSSRRRHTRCLSDWSSDVCSSDLEARLFADRDGPRARLAEWAAVVAGCSLLVAAFTWPQLRRMDSVPDMGDPLFSI